MAQTDPFPALRVVYTEFLGLDAQVTRKESLQRSSLPLPGLQEPCQKHSNDLHYPIIFEVSGSKNHIP